jgi:hypothetical protein
VRRVSVGGKGIRMIGIAMGVETGDHGIETGVEDEPIKTDLVLVVVVEVVDDYR